MTLLRRTPSDRSETWLVVGLGNPGAEYANTRHNLGYRVAQVLADRMGGAVRVHRSRRADVVEGRLGRPGEGGPRAVVAKPRSYMNDSGGPVRAMVDFYRVTPEHLVVIHDELDLPAGSLRVKLGGGDNGHNGLRSIRQALGSGEFLRVRLGIGRPSQGQSASDFVLSSPPASARRELDDAVGRAADAVESVVKRGILLTQSDYH